MRLMSRKTHEKKLTARAPRRLRDQFRMMLIEEGVFFIKIGQPGTIEDVLAAVAWDFLHRPEKDRRAILERRMPEIATMYLAEAEEAPSVDGSSEHGLTTGHRRVNRPVVDRERVDEVPDDLGPPKRRR